MGDVVRITGTRKNLKNEKKFKIKAQEIGGVDVDFLCYLDIYYDGHFRYIKDNKTIKDYDMYRISGGIGTNGFGMRAGLNYYFGHLKKKKILDTINRYITDTSKFQQLLFLHHYNFSTPKTLFFHITKDYVQQYIKIIKKQLNFPFIAKDLYMDRGKGVFLIENDQQLEEKILSYDNKGILFQKYIKNTGEFRVLTIGDKIAGTLKRYNPHHYRNNIVKGAIFENICIDKKLEHIVLDMVKKYQLDFAGIDIIVSKNTYHVLEINTAPQFQRMENVTGIDIMGKLISFLKKNK